MPESYEPALEWGVANPGAPARGEEGTYGPGGGGGNVPWVPAPSSSHIVEFKYYDSRDHRFLTKFPTPIGQGRSELHVRFKGKNGSVSGTYAYYYDNPDDGKNIFNRLQSSAHPYSEVLYPHVIKAKIQYTKID